MNGAAINLVVAIFNLWLWQTFDITAGLVFGLVSLFAALVFAILEVSA